jgi:large repetitive protein
MFGTTAASSFVLNTDASITAVSPAFSGTGTVDVRVVTSKGTSAISAADKFTYTG